MAKTRTVTEEEMERMKVEMRRDRVTLELPAMDYATICNVLDGLSRNPTVNTEDKKEFKAIIKRINDTPFFVRRHIVE
ncbi:MAG: hypothetical protein WCJ84_02450 [Candidatus Peregrinibacteria bacterium]